MASPPEASPPARDVSAVVVTYNSAAVIELALNSIVTNGGAHLAEVVVLDNASTDITREVVSEAIRQLPPTACPVRLVTSAKNAGYGAGSNAGVRAAAPQARYVLLLNPDIELAPSLIDEMRAVLEAAPAAGLVGPRVEYTDEYGLPNPTNNSFWFDGVLARLTGGRWRRMRPGDTRPTLTVQGCCALARRAAFEQAGGFDENMFLYLEEAVISVRLRRAGYATLCLWSGGVVRHFQNTSAAPEGEERVIRGRRKIELYRATERYVVEHYLPRHWRLYSFLSKTPIYRLWINYIERAWVGSWQSARRARTAGGGEEAASLAAGPRA